MLERVISRTRRAELLNEVVTATTTDPGDDLIVRLLEKEGYSYFRGSREDLLDRYYQSAKAFKADVIVRITSDCPMIEPEIIDSAVSAYIEGQPETDYASNVFPLRTFPRGLDVEVFGFNVLSEVWVKDDDPRRREHVVPYIHQNQNEFKIINIKNSDDLSFMRWTVDTKEDLRFVKLIYDHFGHDSFHWMDVVELLRENPDWMEINRHVVQKTI